MPKLSVVIPAHNEEGCIEGTVRSLYGRLVEEGIDHELVVVNDNSTDDTGERLARLTSDVPTLRSVDNPPPNGFGLAVRKGLESVSGDAVAVVMADASDTPEDLVRFWRTMWREDVECVFGSRFTPQSRVVEYPWLKRAINRLANRLIAGLFGLRYDDVTNAFKLYRKHVIAGIQPLLSRDFNLTVELPLKAIVRGYSYAVVSNDWINRKAGESKLKMREMSTRYFGIVLYCFIEARLSRRDYRPKEIVSAERIR